MQLIHEATRTPAVVGDVLRSRSGEFFVLRYIQEPHKPASTGRVYVSYLESEAQMGYFPSVFDLVWEGRNDQ